MIDWNRIQELEEEVGPEDFDEVVQLFLEEVEERIAMLASNTTAPEIESTLHFLKGSALNLGFSQFSMLCQAGETAAAGGQTHTINRTAIVDSFQISKQVFLKEIASRQIA